MTDYLSSFYDNLLSKSNPDFNLFEEIKNCNDDFNSMILVNFKTQEIFDEYFNFCVDLADLIDWSNKTTVYCISTNRYRYNQFALNIKNNKWEDPLNLLSSYKHLNKYIGTTNESIKAVIDEIVKKYYYYNDTGEFKWLCPFDNFIDDYTFAYEVKEFNYVNINNKEQLEMMKECLKQLNPYLQKIYYYVLTYQIPKNYDKFEYC